jgi:hypothetical protein
MQKIIACITIGFSLHASHEPQNKFQQNVQQPTISQSEKEKPKQEAPSQDKKDLIKIKDGVWITPIIIPRDQ